MKRGFDQETSRSPVNPIEMETEDTIRRRAYELYKERGRGDEHELEAGLRRKSKYCAPGIWPKQHDRGRKFHQGVGSVRSSPF